MQAVAFAALALVAFTFPRALAQAPKNYPVTSVVELLRDMQAELQKEADRDQEVYEKLACWCETNDKGKTKNIADAQVRIVDLGDTIQKMTAMSTTLNIEIKNLEKEVAKNQESLDVATALREKQHAEFIGEEKEMVQSIQALNAAVVVLGKHHGASLVSSRAVVDAAAAAHAVLQRHAALLQGTVTPRERRMLQSLAQQEPGGFIGKKPTLKEAYAPQSGEIFGILKEMKATFEADLSESQKEEVENQQSYESLKAAKEEEIKTGQASLEDKKQQLAAADEKLAQSKQALEDTEASLSADQKFLMELKVKCSLTDKEWEERQTTRNEEISAVSEAISILSSDDARDLFSRTFNKAAVLVQTRSARRSSGRDRAVALLVQVAARTGSPQLAALATAARLDAFTRVKKAIDDMVAQLLKEKELEITHRDYCISELDKNELTTNKEVHTKANLEEKISGLELTVSGLKAAIDTLTAEITDLEQQKERAKEDRELQNKEFQQTIGDQREAQRLVGEALAGLKRFYAEKEASLVQQARRQEPAPPGFKPYEKSGAATPVLALLEKIIADAKAMEEETMHAEAEAKDAYTKLVQDTADSVKAKQDAIVDRTTEKTQKEQDLLQAKSELEGTVTELETLSSDKAALHGECDYILKNFEMRQASRDDEVAALRQAKAYLSGEHTL